VAELDPRPHPPGDYPVVVVGTGPGGLQTSYCLARLGIEHALLSADDGPGGMFRSFPLFQRLITWTKLHAPVSPEDRAFEWYDWNSLLGEEAGHRDLVRPLMDGVSYFPSRAEMERGLAAFAERAGLRARFGCTWTATARRDDGFAVETSDGEYRCRVLVVATGMTQPWKPPIAGLEHVPHYVETRPAAEYAGKRVFIVGKRNSGFELADALLPWATQIVLGSPRPAQISVLTHSTAAARARYLQPYEDHVLGGGNLVLDCAIERVERSGDRYRVHAAGTTRPGSLRFDVDDVIAATGFATPLGDLPALGVKTFYQGRLPAQTPLWESVTVPGIYFAGSITQGAIGLKKYGIPSNSAAVHGFRYNARTLATHLARTHFGIEPPRRAIGRDDVVPYLLSEVTRAPELWNQQSYLARILSFDPAGGPLDEGIWPLATFVDSTGHDAVAATVETDPTGEIRPAVYVRERNRVEERVLPSHPLLDFRTPEHHAELEGILKSMLA
jgi:thioredoxin reductase